MIFHVHYTFSKNSGEIRRIQNINNDLALTLSDDVIEIAFISTVLFLKRKKYKFKLNDNIKKKYYIPRIPLSNSNVFALKIDNIWTSFILLILYIFYKPQYIISEFSISYRSLLFIPKHTIKIIDIHGALKEEYEYNNIHWNHKLALYYDSLEKLGLEKSSYVICQSDVMKRHLIQKYNLINNNIYIYRCAADINLFYYAPNIRDTVRKEIGVNDSDILFVYSGGMHKWQKIEESLAFFELFYKEHKHCYFLILTLQIDYLNHLINEKFSNINDRIIIKSVSNKDVCKYLNAADVAFLLRDNVIMNAVASPTKLSEYMACGLSIISTSVAKLWLNNNLKYVFNIEERSINELPDFIKRTNHYEIAEFASKFLSLDYDKQQISNLIRNAKSKQHIN